MIDIIFKKIKYRIFSFQIDGSIKKFDRGKPLITTVKFNKDNWIEKVEFSYTYNS